jgi:DNA mismatch repair ATPase MutS
MTTTHYSDLECLEKDTKGSFENYKFEVTHNQEGEIEFNYELKKGEVEGSRG